MNWIFVSYIFTEMIAILLFNMPYLFEYCELIRVIFNKLFNKFKYPNSHLQNIMAHTPLFSYYITTNAGIHVVKGRFIIYLLQTSIYHNIYIEKRLILIYEMTKLFAYFYCKTRIILAFHHANFM